MKKSIVYIAGAAVLLSALGARGKSAGNLTDVSQNMVIFNSILKELNMNYVDSIDVNKNVRYAIDAMLSQIDPYTTYYNIDEIESLTSISSGQFSGIGCVISARNGQVEMNSPRWDSPSQRAGVRHGDILLAIDGDTLPANYSTSDASSRLRGPAGTTVHLTLKRPYANDSIFDIDIVRGTITDNPVPYYGMVGDGVGYISLTTFNEKSAADVKNALLELKKNKDFKYLILDLRDNGGGLITSAVQIAGLFVPKGTEVVRTRYRDAENEKIYTTPQKPVDTELPMIILTDYGTASASEIVAGSMQDLDRAVILGERSYGKGLVQATREMPYEGYLKVTVARYYIPSGRLIQAIDYSHRNPDGSVARTPDSLTNVFHTRNGREVRDGGGITPDVKTEAEDINRLIYNIVTDQWAYNYANRFRERQGDNMPAAADFVVTDSIFADFKAFIDPEKFKYDRACESGLQYMREAVEIEGYKNDSITAILDQLETLLKHDLNHDLDFNRDKIIGILDEEISERYYSEADQIMRALRTDKDVLEAIKIFNTPGRYEELLTPKK